jgi:hypothetical protein
VLGEDHTPRLAQLLRHDLPLAARALTILREGPAWRLAASPTRLTALARVG